MLNPFFFYFYVVKLKNAILLVASFDRALIKESRGVVVQKRP
jgi:hypothetical protein